MPSGISGHEGVYVSPKMWEKDMRLLEFQVKGECIVGVP